MDRVSLTYFSHFGEDLSVDIDFVLREVTGPGASTLLKSISSWEWSVKNNKTSDDHWMHDMTRDPVRIDHPWASPRDMAVFMRFSEWSDESQWPPDFAALIPPPAPEEPPSGIGFVN